MVSPMYHPVKRFSHVPHPVRSLLSSTLLRPATGLKEGTTSATSGEFRILLYWGLVLSDGVKHAFIRYFKSDLQVDEKMFSAISRKLSGSADPDNKL
jgi:hypothetical protein